MTPPILREAHYSPVALKMKEVSPFTPDMDATTCKVTSWKILRASRVPANAVDEARRDHAESELRNYVKH